VKPIEGNLTGVKAYRALLSLAFEHKVYFAVAVVGMIAATRMIETSNRRLEDIAQ